MQMVWPLGDLVEVSGGGVREGHAWVFPGVPPTFGGGRDGAGKRLSGEVAAADKETGTACRAATAEEGFLAAPACGRQARNDGDC